MNSQQGKGESVTAEPFDADRLGVLRQTIERDVDRGLYWGAVLKIARHGELVFDEAIGYGDEQRANPLRVDSVFSIFSATKAFVNVLVLRAIERGQFALTTKMADLVPEFGGAPRDRATIFNFLTHTTGMPGVWEPRPGLLLDRLEDAVEAVCRYIQGVEEPGTRCDYAPMANHTLLAEALRRTDPAGRDFVTIVRQDLFEPLGMSDTSFGVAEHMHARHVVPDMRGIVPIMSRSRENDDPNGLYTASYNEAAWVGAASTTGDLLKFMEMLRGEGTYQGTRILSSRTVRVARQNWTGDMPNELYKAVALRAGYPVPPACIGLGFNVRGTKIVNTQLGTLTTPGTFGNYGAGSVLEWVDPELDITFVALTAGLLDQARNIERFQRVSDLVVAAAT
jgi:CubicO group peptidase (beta-lactamase class C family)